jgi:hypothetical protein
MWIWAFWGAIACQIAFVWFTSGRKGLSDLYGISPNSPGLWLLVLHASFVNLVIVATMAVSLRRPEFLELSSTLAVASFGAFAVLSMFFLRFAPSPLARRGLTISVAGLLFLLISYISYPTG